MVSIIILVQDRYDFVKRCLESIINYTTQTDYELVLILQAVKNQRILDLVNSLPCKKIVIYNEINNGVTNGRNQGIELSNGDYLLFLDDDAWVSEELENIFEYLRQYDWLGRMLYFYKKADAECGVVSGCCFMFSRSVINSIGLLNPYFEKFWHAESEYFTRTKYNGFKIINIPYVGVRVGFWGWRNSQY